MRRGYDAHAHGRFCIIAETLPAGTSGDGECRTIDSAGRILQLESTDGLVDVTEKAALEPRPAEAPLSGPAKYSVHGIALWNRHYSARINWREYLVGIVFRVVLSANADWVSSGDSMKSVWQRLGCSTPRRFHSCDDWLGLEIFGLAFSRFRIFNRLSTDVTAASNSTVLALSVACLTGGSPNTVIIHLCQFFDKLHVLLRELSILFLRVCLYSQFHCWV